MKADMCAGFGRPSHHSVVLFRQYQDGHRDGLCRKCADKFNGSNENWGDTDMNEEEIRDYLWNRGLKPVKIARFKNFDRITYESKDYKVTANLRKHIEEFPVSVLKEVVGL